MAYVNPLAQLTGPRATIANLGRTDQGVDVTGSGPVLALGSGKVLQTLNPGWPGGGFIVIALDNPIAGHGYYYTAENIAPAVTPGQHVTAGQVIGHARGTSPYLELGWAAGPPNVGESLARATTGYTEGQVTPAGQDFRSVLTSLMAGQQPAAGGTTATLTSAQTGTGTTGQASAGAASCLLALALLPLLIAISTATAQHQHSNRSGGPVTWINSLPAVLRFLAWLLIIVIIVIVLAIVIHALGGFNWSLTIGHFHWDIGVT